MLATTSVPPLADQLLEQHRSSSSQNTPLQKVLDAYRPSSGDGAALDRTRCSPHGFDRTLCRSPVATEVPAAAAALATLACVLPFALRSLCDQCRQNILLAGSQDLKLTHRDFVVLGSSILSCFFLAFVPRHGFWVWPTRNDPGRRLFPRHVDLSLSGARIPRLRWHHGPGFARSSARCSLTARISSSSR